MARGEEQSRSGRTSNRQDECAAVALGACFHQLVSSEGSFESGDRLIPTCSKVGFRGMGECVAGWPGSWAGVPCRYGHRALAIPRRMQYCNKIGYNRQLELDISDLWQACRATCSLQAAKPKGGPSLMVAGFPGSVLPTRRRLLTMVDSVFGQERLQPPAAGQTALQPS